MAGYCINNKRKVDIAADEENKRIYNQKNNLLSDLTDIKCNIKYNSSSNINKICI